MLIVLDPDDILRPLAKDGSIPSALAVTMDRLNLIRQVLVAQIVNDSAHADGMAVLGTMYLFGQGVQNDAKKATQWLELAAGRGQVDAQSILGIMYATGQGVARNIPEAKKWLTRASEAGDKHAIRMLQMIEGPR